MTRAERGGGRTHSHVPGHAGKLGLGTASALLLAGALGLAGCAAPRPPPVPTGAACLADLSRHQVAFEAIQLDPGPGGCVIDTPVRVRATGVAWNRPGTVSCAMAERLAEWEIAALQPAAERHLGSRVVRLEHLGAYACRAETSSRAVVSQHGYGRAIDVAGFVLADGSRVSVARDWADPGPRGRFLRALAQASCEAFSVVLSPGFNRLHADHLHLDIGPDRLCGV